MVLNLKHQIKYSQSTASKVTLTTIAAHLQAVGLAVLWKAQHVRRSSMAKSESQAVGGSCSVVGAQHTTEALKTMFVKNAMERMPNSLGSYSAAGKQPRHKHYSLLN